MNGRHNYFVACAVLALALGTLVTSARANLVYDPSFEITPPGPRPPSSFGQVVGPPFTPNLWGAENATIVGAEHGVTPRCATHMLRMENEGLTYTQAWQAINISTYAAAIDNGCAFAFLNAAFNSDTTGAIGVVTLHYFQTASSWGTELPGSPISQGITLDASVNTWQPQWVAGYIPIGARWMVVELAFNDASLHGHYGYVDCVNYDIDTSGCPTGSATVGKNADFRNTTGQVANNFEILLQGTYTASDVHHWDGVFNSFGVSYQFGNTLLTWRSGTNIAPNQLVHAGFNVPGSVVHVNGMFWTRDSVVTGCAHQINIGHGTHPWGSPGSEVVFINDALGCESVPRYVGDTRIEWHAIEVPLGLLNPDSLRAPMRTDSLPGPPLLLAPGASSSVSSPIAPDGATYGVIIHKVSSNANLSPATLDFWEFQVGATGNPATDVPPLEGAPPRTGVLELRNNPLRRGNLEIRFSLERADRVEAKVFDVSGRLVRTLPAGSLDAGEQSLLWDGTDKNGHRLPSGVYFVQVTSATSGMQETKRAVIVR